MKKLINDPSRYVDEALEGLCTAFSGYRKRGRVVARAAGRRKAKSALSLEAASAICPYSRGRRKRNVECVRRRRGVRSLSTYSNRRSARGGGVGVVCVLGNCGGDRMSFATACDAFEDDGGYTATVIVADDVASASASDRAKRRGVAGMVFAFKTAGAAADAGASLDDVKGIAQHTTQRTRSIGVALSPCLIPGAAAPGFSVGEGQLELDMGIHGEPGVERRAIVSANEVAQSMMDRLLADRDEKGGRVAVLVNSLGATPLEELLIVYHAITKVLGKTGVELARSYVGHYATSMEMVGCSLSIVDLDDEIEWGLARPTDCPFWPR